MVFGFLSRITQPAQLRTPSPSIDGQREIIAIPAPTDEHDATSLPPATPSPPPVTVPTTKDELAALITSVPPQTLHSYTINHLSSATAPPSPNTVTAITSFFSALSPPPRLHCVRCHKSYFDVENSDRSCLVPHDDDSAVVERVGGGYETLYGCCERTVQGDGDMGPPDGYCYEGKHTTDLKRARFRADSSIQHDKLTSCVRMRCFEPPAPPSDSESSDSATTSRSRRRTTKRKRTQSMAQKEEDVEEDATVVNDAETGSTGSKAPKPRAPRKKRAKTKSEDKPFKPTSDDDDDEMDIDDTASSASKPRRKPRPKARKAPATPSSNASPFPSSGTTSPILKPSRVSQSPTRSSGHGRNVSFSNVSVVVERRRTKSLKDVVAASE